MIVFIVSAILTVAFIIRLCSRAAANAAENDCVCCVADNRGVLWSKRCRGRWEQTASLLHLVCSVETDIVPATMQPETDRRTETVSHFVAAPVAPELARGVWSRH